MADQFVILNEDYILVDDHWKIKWSDKGNAMPSLPATVHAVIWNNLNGPNEIQYKDASTHSMTVNTNLSATSDSVGSTTVADLLTWATTRSAQIEQAHLDFRVAGFGEPGTASENKSWIDYDPNHS